eukprot:TRINITY_DN17092_c0_g1_i1.p1 TRINITY_DN17092_c0_g1~~TRINITY_DN17092_c0_g1_i1.p1  ORF type:complete len:164 (-),score=35.32 TRINITY_DN17092_c0_g1_i1:10-501(-)
MIKDCLLFEMNVYIMRNFNTLPYYLIDDNKPSKSHNLSSPTQLTIDIWVLPDSDNVSQNMCMFLGFILSRTKNWKIHARIRINSVVVDDIEPKEELENLEKFVAEYRIPCEDIYVFAMADFVEEEKDDESSGRYTVMNRVIKRKSSNHSCVSLSNAITNEALI